MIEDVGISFYNRLAENECIINEYVKMDGITELLHRVHASPIKDKLCITNDVENVIE